MPQRQEAVQNSLGGCRKGHPSRKCCWSGEEGCGVPAALSSWSPFPGHKGPGRHGHTVSLATARTHGRNRSMTPRQSAGCHKSLGEGPGRHTAVGKASLSWTHRPCGQGSLRRTPGGGGRTVCSHLLCGPNADVGTRKLHFPDSLRTRVK